MLPFVLQQLVYAPFIARHLIDATEVRFGDFAGDAPDPERNRTILGLTTLR